MEEKKNQALYRRYRSTSFDELVGQDHVTELLKAAVQHGTFSHAYLFTGQRGTGKTSAARLLAYAINDLPYETNTNHLDIIEIDAASNRRIDDIRDLREKVFVAPVSAKYKVYIIDEVHMLTNESFNALLKTLEEPPEHAIFILATTELHKVPATIVSRTQRFHFRPVALAKIVDHLKSIASQEKITITDEALRLIAEHGGGSFRDSISLLDQVGGLQGEITEENVESLLGRARSTDVATLLDALENGDQSSLHSLLESLMSQGTSPVTLSEQIVATLLKNPRSEKRWYELTEKLMSIPKAHFPQLLLMSTLLGFAATKEKRDVDRAQNTQVMRSENREIEREQQITTQETASKVEEKVAKKKTIEKTESIGTFDWTMVLEMMKKTNPALFAVLSRAETSFADNTLTLSFQYALHRKKLDQPQYRTQLSRCIQDVCGINPAVVINETGPQLANDDTAKKVADLMGGGERVTV